MSDCMCKTLGYIVISNLENMTVQIKNFSSFQDFVVTMF